jgi:hypothetical protein
LTSQCWISFDNDDENNDDTVMVVINAARLKCSAAGFDRHPSGSVQQSISARKAKDIPQGLTDSITFGAAYNATDRRRARPWNVRDQRYRIRRELELRWLNQWRRRERGVYVPSESMVGVFD